MKRLLEPLPAGRMVRPRRALAALAAALAGLIILGACGGNEAKEPNNQTVDEQLGLEDDGILQRQARAENLIRDCMKAEGFEYVPVDPAAQKAALVGSADLSEEEFNEQFGYGITTLYEKRLAQRASGPNEAIRARLSEAERAAYDRALYGDPISLTFAEALDTGNFGGLGGCTKQATEEVFGGLEVIQDLQTKLDVLDERIVADPRVAKAIREWSQCMRSAGYDLSDPEQVDTVLETKLQEIVGTPDPNADPAAPPEYDRAALAALQREEVAMVKADIACEERHIADVEEEVRAEYEREFREENAALLSKVPPP